MSYQKLKCRNGHTFYTYVATKYSKVECPDCKRKVQDEGSRMTDVNPTDYSFQASDCGFSSGDSSSSSSSSSDFSSGDGGSFGGGGSSGDW